MNMSNLGKNILKLRKKQGLTQAELARRLNISDKAVSKWENGGGYPEITLLPALSKIFGVSVDYLLKGNPRGIAVAGSITADIVNIIDRYPEKNMLANILSTVYAVGGCVPNTIINLAKLEPELSLSAYGRVGEDEQGRYVLSCMRKYGINTEGIIRSKELNTSCSHVMSESDTGERTFFFVNGANSQFCIEDIALDSLDCEIFHIGYLLLLDRLDEKDAQYGSNMARLLCGLRERGIKTSIDVISRAGADFKSIIPALKYCDYAVMNEIESCGAAGLNPRKADGELNLQSIKNALSILMEHGIKQKAIIHCSEAGFMMNADGSFLAVPSLLLPAGFIKGSVGAGDAYAAGCLYGLYNNYDDRRILEFASCAAACCLSESDSVSGMRPREEVERLNSIYPRRRLEI